MSVMSLMPETDPKIEGVEIVGKCLPANTVSGDFFDYLQGERKHEIALVVVDVTGKAMKGVMNAMMTDGILRMAAKEQGKLSPTVIMVGLNDVLKERMEDLMNVTMVIGLIDIETKMLTLANASHHAHPLLQRNGEVKPLMARDMLMGMKAGITYREVEFSLRSSYVLVFMTDGIIKAQDDGGDLYSDSGLLLKAVSQFGQDFSAKAMVEIVLNDALLVERMVSDTMI